MPLTNLRHQLDGALPGALEPHCHLDDAVLVDVAQLENTEKAVRLRDPRQRQQKADPPNSEYSVIAKPHPPPLCLYCADHFILPDYPHTVNWTLDYSPQSKQGETLKDLHREESRDSRGVCCATPQGCCSPS